jgi:hypothetical protein
MNWNAISRRDFMRRTAGAAGATVTARSVLLEPEPIAAAPLPRRPRSSMRGTV